MAQNRKRLTAQKRRDSVPRRDGTTPSPRCLRSGSKKLSHILASWENKLTEARDLRALKKSRSPVLYSSDSGIDSPGLRNLKKASKKLKAIAKAANGGRRSITRCALKVFDYDDSDPELENIPIKTPKRKSRPQQKTERKDDAIKPLSKRMCLNVPLRGKGVMHSLSIDRKEADAINRKKASTIDRKEASTLGWKEANTIDRMETSTIDRKEASTVDRKEANTIDRKKASTIGRKKANSTDRKEASTVNSREASTIDRKDASTIERKKTSTIERNEASTIDRKDARIIDRNKGSTIERKKASTIEIKEASIIDRKEASVIDEKRASTINGKKASIIDEKESNTVDRKEASAIDRKKASTQTTLSQSSSAQAEVILSSIVPSNQVDQCDVSLDDREVTVNFSDLQKQARCGEILESEAGHLEENDAGSLSRNTFTSTPEKHSNSSLMVQSSPSSLLDLALSESGEITLYVSPEKLSPIKGKASPASSDSCYWDEFSPSCGEEALFVTTPVKEDAESSLMKSSKAYHTPHQFRRYLFKDKPKRTQQKQKSKFSAEAKLDAWASVMNNHFQEIEDSDLVLE